MERPAHFRSAKILLWIYFSLIFAAVLKKAKADLPGSYEKDVDSSWDPYSTAGVEKSATCVKLKYGNCMGTNLTYSMTSLDLIPEHTTQDLIEDRLRLLQSLRHIPRCWAVVQPLLCSLFKPKCNNKTIELPSQEFCKKILSPCRILFNHTIWPSFIKCDNPKLFPKEGKDFSRFLPFNISGKCFKPLIATDNPLTTFEGIEGCGIPCNDPLYTADEHDQIHSFIRWGATICMTSNLFTICTFLIDWRSANKYPALVIFYINCCFLVNCFGWMLQFTLVTRESIVCQKDGTLRTQEPSGDTWLCVIVFVLIYYTSMAIMAWFVIFSYAWHIGFKTISTIQDKITKKSTYFHMFAWSVPLFLTLAVITRAEVDGNSVTGICFVGYTNPISRSVFVLGPIVVGIVVGGYFLSRGLITLIRLKIKSQNLVSERAYAKIRDTFFRMVFFSLLTFFVVIITMYCHVYEFQNSWQWHQSFRDYIICAITTKYDEGSTCKVSSRPSVTKLQLHLLAPFLAGVLMSLWVWNGSTVDTWKRFFRRRFNPDPDEPMKLKKHKVIAQAFAKRKTFNNAGRLSISFHNTHDPVGLNFDLNSVASQDFSSTWAAALPKFVTRRDALIVGNGGSVSSYRRNSVDSEVSFSVQRVSVHSRRNSLDSQISVQIAEVKACRKRGSSVPRTKRSKQKKGFAKSSSRVGPLFRRGSTTSQESHHAQILSALAAYGSSQIPNMKRRSAMAGLDDSISNSKVLNNKNAQILLPLFFGDQSDSDENSSVDKLKTLENKSKDADDKEERDSESEDSEADEETKMIKSKEQDCGRSSRSRSRSSKSGKGREGEKSKFSIQNEVAIKHFSQELDKLDTKKLKDKEIDKDVLKKSNTSNLHSSSDSSPEIARSILSDAQGTAREMATQTSLPLDVLEMEELKQSIDEIINSRNSSSKATQMSPQLR